MRKRKRSAVALRHVAFEDLGLLGAVLERNGWEVAYRSAPVEDLSAPGIADSDLFIVLGGPVGVYQGEAYPFVSSELRLLHKRLTRSSPTLGICLGCQLVAKALGARVFVGTGKEIGWGPVALTREGRKSCLAPLAEEGAAALHWHGDAFDLPAGATRLAFNENYENQAFAFDRSTLALQFHLEADPARLEEWLVGHAAELVAAGVSPIELRGSTRAAAAGARSRADRIFSDWLRQIDDAA